MPKLHDHVPSPLSFTVPIDALSVSMSPSGSLTFFPWAFAARGSRGVGQITVTAFSVPEGALGFWKTRLETHGINVEETGKRFEEEVLTLLDPDGLTLELVAHPGAEDRPPWRGGGVSAEHAIRDLHAVTLSEQGYESTANLLTEVMGFELTAEDGNRFRFDGGGGGAGARVDVLCVPDAPEGRIAAGSVHHVAFRVANDGSQIEWRERLRDSGLDVTPVLDRQYFKSIYFQEPGGVLFEIATDPPGFTRDEPVSGLGSALELPPWLERHRERIEAVLPPIVVRGTAS